MLHYNYVTLLLMYKHIRAKMLIRFMKNRLSAVVQWRRTLILQLYHFVLACQNQNTK